jgi:hypothetical protein
MLSRPYPFVKSRSSAGASPARINFETHRRRPAAGFFVGLFFLSPLPLLPPVKTGLELRSLEQEATEVTEEENLNFSLLGGFVVQFSVSSC